MMRGMRRIGCSIGVGINTKTVCYLCESAGYKKKGGRLADKNQRGKRWRDYLNWKEQSEHTSTYRKVR
jgi:hypothetical protein